MINKLLKTFPALSINNREGEHNRLNLYNINYTFYILITFPYISLPASYC